MPEYRKGGLMSKLISEAQTFCRANGSDFISLVPSSDSLYSYYSRFNFQESMYCLKSSGCLHHKPAYTKLEEINDISELEKLRTSYEGNMIIAEGESLEYILTSLKAYKVSINKISDDSCFMISAEDNRVIEFISSEKNLNRNTSLLFDALPEKAEISSPFELPHCEKNEKIRFGMLYPINKNLQRSWEYTDIYMNLALD